MMLRRHFVSQALTLGTATATLASLGGCGTLLHSERLNQPHSRDLDWKIVALNGLGLIFFFIPGVIAFVVDFHTGAIYLPPHYGAGKPPSPAGMQPSDGPQQLATQDIPQAPANSAAAQPAPLRKVAVVSGELNLVTIEREVSQHAGRPVWVNEAASRVARLDALDEFVTAQRRCQSDQTFGLSPQAFLQRWLPGAGRQAAA